MTKQTEPLEVTVIPKEEIEKYVTGIPTERAANLKKAFTPIIDLMDEYEQEYNEIVSIDTWTREDARKARKLRLKYVKVRTGADTAHKEVKADLLLQTKAIDGMRAIIRATVSGKENQLAEIENYIENKRKEEIKAKQDERELALSDYGVTNFPATLGEMEDDEWERYFTETRNEYMKRKKAEEEAALAKERTNKILRYASYVENFDAIDFAKFSQKEFDKLYETAKEKSDKADEEMARLKAEMEARQKALAEAEKKREEELFQGNDDKERLLSIARQFREQELPTFTTVEGKQIEKSIRTYLNALSDKIEQKVTELFTEETF